MQLGSEVAHTCLEGSKIGKVPLLGELTCLATGAIYTGGTMVGGHAAWKRGQP